MAEEVELVFKVNASTGECPTWSEPEQALYWIDIEQPGLHRLDVASGQDKCWPLPAQIGSFALTRNGRVIAALRTGLIELDLQQGTSRLLAPPPYDSQTHRFNDGRCDARGRFWVGIIYKPLARGGAQSKPSLQELEHQARLLHVYSASTGLQPAQASAIIANGLAFSPDDRFLYFCDSKKGTIWRFGLDLELGFLTSQTVFAQLDSNQGEPDGAAVDEEGFYWTALYGAGCIVRLDPYGNIVRRIAVPASQPTACTFGGRDLDTLYITSAANGIDLKREPLAGSIFRCRPGVRGRAAMTFAG